MLPVFFGHKHGEICCYIVPGGTPFLLARPIMEQLQLTLDFGHQRARWHEGEWFQVRRSHIGHYVIDLLEDYGKIYYSGREPDYVLIPDDFSSHVHEEKRAPVN
jgi:hypothetical protein